MRDAAVALRSLPRRYSEIVSGPTDDDTWDQTVRTIADNGQSGLGWVARTTEAVTALGTAIAALPLQSRPSVSLAKATQSINESRLGTPKQAIDELRAVAERAALAIEGRDPDDFDRVCTVDGAERSARDLVTDVVGLSVANLKHAQTSIDAATAS